jgi:hypothetical protein
MVCDDFEKDVGRSLALHQLTPYAESGLLLTLRVAIKQ